jgi:hypothetical protein
MTGAGLSLPRRAKARVAGNMPLALFPTNPDIAGDDY